MQTYFNRLLDHLAYHGIRAWARLGGLHVVVRYLRNPRPAVTVRLLRAYGAQVGDGTTCKGALTLDNASEDRNSTGDFSHLRIGPGCYIGEDVYFDLAAPIAIGANSMLSARTAVLGHAECSRSPALARLYPRLTAGVTVEPGCWIGVGAILLPGVTIGRECVVAAGAVVTANTSPRTLAAGVPARPVKSLPQ